MRWSDEGDDGAVALAVGARNNGGEAAVDACARAAVRLSEAMKWRACAASQLHGATSNRGGRRDGCRRAGGVGDRCQVPRCLLSPCRQGGWRLELLWRCVGGEGAPRMREPADALFTARELSVQAGFTASELSLYCL